MPGSVKRALVEVLLVGLVLAGIGVGRMLPELDSALLPGELLPLVGLELLSLPLAAVLVALLFSSPLLRLGPVGAAAAMASLAAIELLGRGWVPDDLPGVAILLGAALLGRILARRWAPSRWLWAVLAVVAAVGSWPETRDVAPAPGGQPPQRLVLVTLDTFRADHLGVLDESWFDMQTPTLDALSDQGLFFTQGVAPVALTLPSHSSMLTGRAPTELGVLRNGHRLPDEVQTVAEALADQGWTTGAFLGAAVLQRHGGIDQGFHHFDDVMGPRARWQTSTLGRGLARAELIEGPEVRRPGDQVVARALQWLEKQEGPVFLWVHLYDAHSPYEPPAPYDGLYDPDLPGVPGDPAQVRQLRKEFAKQHFLAVTPVPKDLRPSLAAYAGGISWVDHLVGELLAELPEDTSLVVAADHGESLVEHGYLLNHGWLVNQASVRVPLWVRAPDVPVQRVDTPTPVSAVGPTLLQLAGLDGQGSLLDRAADPPRDEVLEMFGTTQQSRRVFTVVMKWRVGWRLGDIKWVMDERGEPRRYDLSVDPDELVDTSEGDPDKDLWALRSREEIERLKAANKASRSAQGQLEALRALGYVQ